jgi:hypothetical protein
MTTLLRCRFRGFGGWKDLQRSFRNESFYERISIWIAEPVQRGGTRCKPEPSAARTVAAPDYKIFTHQDLTK